MTHLHLYIWYRHGVLNPLNRVILKKFDWMLKRNWKQLTSMIKTVPAVTHGGGGVKLWGYFTASATDS